MEPCSASLFLSKVAHDLTNTRVTEQVWVHGRWLANRAVASCTQGQHTYLGSLRCGSDDLPRTHAIDVFAPTVSIMLP